MEINAKIAKGGKHIRLIKQGGSQSSLITLIEAKAAHRKGLVTTSNRCFQVLAELKFDVQKTLDYYRDNRSKSAASSTDDS